MPKASSLSLLTFGGMSAASSPPKARLAGQIFDGIEGANRSPNLHGGAIAHGLYLRKLLVQLRVKSFRPIRAEKSQQNVRLGLSAVFLRICHENSPHDIFAQLEQIETLQVLLNMILLYNKIVGKSMKSKTFLNFASIFSKSFNRTYHFIS